MIVYQTDHDGFFINTVQADPSPLEPGVWLIPGGAYTKEPPTLAEGERAQWIGDNWIIVQPPEPEPEPVPEPLTIADFSRAIDTHIEAKARELQYNSAAHLASYVASEKRLDWAAEARAFIDWRDDVWTYAIGELNKFESGTRPLPESTESFIAELPVYQTL